MTCYFIKNVETNLLLASWGWKYCR